MTEANGKIILIYFSYQKWILLKYMGTLLVSCFLFWRVVIIYFLNKKLSLVVKYHRFVIELTCQSVTSYSEVP